jgi:hypothetical protein
MTAPRVARELDRATADLIGKVPPHNLEAEAAVLAGVLRKPEILAELLPILEPSDFYSPAHALTFRACRTLAAKGAPVDMRTVADLLNAQGKLEEVGGVPYFANLVEDPVSAAHAAYHARIVREHAARRKAILEATEQIGRAFDPACRFEAREPAGEAVGLPLLCAADVTSESVRWTWPNHIAQGVVNILDGEPGVGKSMLTTFLAAVLTTGGTWPDGSRAEAGDVLMVNLEDDLARTLRPRLEAAGADLSRVHLFDDSGGGFTLPGDLGRLEQAVTKHAVSVVVVDPLMAVLDGKVNSYRDQDVRRVLAALKAMCGRTSCAVILVRHLTKAVGGSAVNRGGGSIGIIGAARVGLLLARDPKDDARRILATVKNNLGPFNPKSSTAWTIAPGPVLTFAGAADVSADELLQEQDEKRKPGRPAEKRGDAEAWLLEALAEGPRLSSDLKAAADADGISWRTVERARDAIAMSYQQDRAWWVELKVRPSDRQNPLHKEIWRPELQETYKPYPPKDTSDRQKVRPSDRQNYFMAEGDPIPDAVEV